MPKDDDSKVCRIFSWLEKQDPKLADFLREYCAEGALSARQGSAGVTFIMPTDALKKKILDEPDPEKGVNMALSCVMPVAIFAGDVKSTDKFGNKLGISFGQTKVNGNTIEFSNGGFTITPEPSFKPFSTNQKIQSVWKLVKGEPPLSGDKYEPPMHHHRPTKTGGSAEAQLPSSRCGWFLHCLRKDITGWQSGYSATLVHCVTIYKYLLHMHPAIWNKAKLTVDICPVVALYLLIEPYKTGDHIIPDDIFEQIKDVLVYNDAVAEYQKIIDISMLDRQAVHQERIVQINSILSSAPTAIADNIKAAYVSYAAKVGGDVNYLIWRDQVRFSMHVKLAVLLEPGLTQQDVESVFSELTICLNLHYKGNDYVKETSFLQKDQFRIRDSIVTAKIFVDSSDFLYAPISVHGGTSGSGEYTQYDLMFDGLLNQYKMHGVDGLAPSVAASLRLKQILQQPVPDEGPPTSANLSTSGPAMAPTTAQMSTASVMPSQTTLEAVQLQ